MIFAFISEAGLGVEEKFDDESLLTQLKLI
jgi:hypothetical protein